MSASNDQTGPSTGSDFVRVSVAMCTYNGGPYVLEQLETIRRQTRLPDELIVCDDASTDDTASVVRTFAATAPFAVHLHVNIQRLGTSRNFQQAIEATCGEIIFLADQDDLWRPEKVAEMLAVFDGERDATGLVFSDGDVVDSAGGTRGYRLWTSVDFTPGERRLFDKGRGFEVLLKHNVVTGAGAAFRAEFKPLVLPIPAEGVHDAWIALLIASVAGVRAVSAPLIQYRHHDRNQIGASKATVARTVKHALRSGGDFYAGLSVQSTKAAERLGMWPASSHLHYARRRLLERALFARFRAEMPVDRIRRVPSVLSQILTGAYHRYARHGLRSAAADFLRPD